jgi:hypothetical protein
MPRPPRTHCKVPGCTNPRHQFPSGYMAVFCSQHLTLRNPRKRSGLPEMPGGVRRLLAYLVECKAAGWEWVPLDSAEVDPRTIRAAFQQDWIFPSVGVDGTTLYKLTTRGQEHYRLYTQGRRKDQLCPRCGVWPRYRRPSGKMNEYCRACVRERGKLRYAARMQRSTP